MLQHTPDIRIQELSCHDPLFEVWTADLKQIHADTFPVRYQQDFFNNLRRWNFKTAVAVDFSTVRHCFVSCSSGGLCRCDYGAFHLTFVSQPSGAAKTDRRRRRDRTNGTSQVRPGLHGAHAVGCITKFSSSWLVGDLTKCCTLSTVAGRAAAVVAIDVCELHDVPVIHFNCCCSRYLLWCQAIVPARLLKTDRAWIMTLAVSPAYVWTDVVRWSCTTTLAK